MGELVLWWLAAELAGLAALPLAAALFANLPDRGWALSKPLGILVVGWLIWLPLVVVSALPYSAGWIAGVFVLFGAGNAALLWRHPPLRQTLRRLVTRERAHVLASEAIFATAFAFMGWFRSFTPDVKDTEKFMDVAFISSLWRAPHLPAPDPWLSGQPINYYYFGHFLIASLAKTLGAQPAVAFNCGIALVFALTAVAVFGVASAIYATARPAGPDRLRRAIPVGVASLVLVLVLGNLAGAQQWWTQALAAVQSSPKVYSSPWAWWLHRELWQTYFYWPPSRVIPNTINEFPAFSFVLADLHAHILALPFAALAVGLAANLLLSRGEGLRVFGRGGLGLLALLATAVALGGLYALNGWDLPTYLGLGLLALALQQWIAHGRRWSALFALDTLAAGTVLAALCVAVYLPFYAGFISPQQGFGLVPATDRSPIGDEFLIYGLYAFLFFSLLALWLSRWAADLIQARAEDAPPGSTWTALRGVERPAARLAVGVVLGGLLLLTVATRGGTLWTLLWCLLIIVACALLARGRLVLPASAAAADGGAPARTPWPEERARRAELFVLCLLATAAALVAVSELMFLRDIFGTRMNTVFKLYFQAWLLLGIAGGPALAWVVAAVRRVLAQVMPAEAWIVVRGASSAPSGPALAFAGAAGRSEPASADLERAPHRHASLMGTSSAGASAQAEDADADGAANDATDGAADGEAAGRERVARFPASQAPRTARGHTILPTGLRWVAAGSMLAWMAALAVLVCAALVFPVLAASNQTQNFTLPHSLDGTAYMRTDPTYVPADCQTVAAGSNAHDDEAIAWLNTHVAGQPVIVEAPGCEWSHYSRVSAFTGLPTLLGWPGGHEGEWRAGWVARTNQYTIFDERLAAINAIYTTTDAHAVLALLRQYHVRLVYVGVAERNLYPKADLDRFRAFLRPVYDRNGVTIYAVP